MARRQLIFGSGRRQDKMKEHRQIESINFHRKYDSQVPDNNLLGMNEQLTNLTGLKSRSLNNNYCVQRFISWFLIVVILSFLKGFEIIKHSIAQLGYLLKLKHPFWLQHQYFQFFAKFMVVCSQAVQVLPIQPCLRNSNDSIESKILEGYINHLCSISSQIAKNTKDQSTYSKAGHHIVLIVVSIASLLISRLFASYLHFDWKRLVLKHVSFNV